MGEGAPGAPGEDVKEAGGAKAAGGPARQDDGLEGVQVDATAAEDAEKKGERVQRVASRGMRCVAAASP